MSKHIVSQTLDALNTDQNMNDLEGGKILLFPEYFYPCSEPALMSDSLLDSKHKNISYDHQKNKLGSLKNNTNDLEIKLNKFMRGYAEFARSLVSKALPEYIPALQWGRTSFRPAQIKGRVSSKRKDDTRLHVDSFAATPVNGLRILRVFCNINPQQEPRVWNVGEPFAQVVNQFAARIPKYNKWVAQCLKAVKATKTLRSAYDHYMLHLHDMMKLDDQYQATACKEQIDFPAQSTWIVFTDHVSHAALSGQFLLEQTFYLPVHMMKNPALSPIHEWSKLKPNLLRESS
jgi:hypothetical protein